MNAIQNFERSAPRGARRRRLVLGFVASTIAAIFATAPAAKADVITGYNLNVTAEVSSYCCAVSGDFITVTGTFLYDNTLGKITTSNLSVTGNLQGSTLPSTGIALTTVNTGSEDQNDIFVSGANSNYRLDFQFVQSLSLETFDAISQQPYTDGGDAQFYDAYDPYSTYHIGYYTVSGGATVPEPASIILMGLPLLALAFIRRRALTNPFSA
jgi:hypothetical protein